jgi:hypothetical protein
MSAEKAAITALATPSSTPYLTAPSHCRYFPAYAGEPTTPFDALAADATSLPVLLAQDHLPAASRAAALLSQIRTHAVRGPPSSLLG